MLVNLEVFVLFVCLGVFIVVISGWTGVLGLAGVAEVAMSMNSHWYIDRSFAWNSLPIHRGLHVFIGALAAGWEFEFV